MAFNNRILAIDDDSAVLQAFESIFTPAAGSADSSLAALGELLSAGSTDSPAPLNRGFFLETADQGEKGFQMLQQAIEEQRPYALVFIDMRMPPGWNGIKTAQRIRAIDPRVQIVIVTAYSDASIPEIVSEVGFTDRLLYLKKPFDDEEILQMADSLTMRWNLEKKTCSFMELLNSIFQSFIGLDFLANSSDLHTFLQEILIQLSQFLDTPNIFLIRFLNDQIDFSLGLGQFENGLIHNEQFQSLLAKVRELGEINEILRLDNYVVMPIICHSAKNIVVGIVPDKEIEGTDKLLSMLARYTGKLCDTGSAMQAMQKDLQESRQQCLTLQQQLEHQGGK